jgi:hypothetical protein
MTRQQREKKMLGFPVKGQVSMSQSNLPDYGYMGNEQKKILSSFPFFGGTTPENTTTTEEKPKTEVTKTAPPATTPTVETEDPIAKLQSDPNALRDLLNQVNKLTADHQNATNALTEIEKEKEKQARAQMSKEEQLNTDLENANLQIEKMNNVIRTVALQNAFVTKSGDTQWNSIKQAMAELDENNYTIDIDLDNGVAEVNGIDNEVKRISKDFPWLVKSAGVTDVNGGARGPGRPRTTGAPPAPPKGNEAKKDRRDSLMNRFPVLMQGR